MTIIHFLVLYVVFSAIPCVVVHIAMRNPPADRIRDVFKLTFLPYVIYCLFTNPEKLK